MEEEEDDKEKEEEEEEEEETWAEEFPPLQPRKEAGVSSPEFAFTPAVGQGARPHLCPLPRFSCGH